MNAWKHINWIAALVALTLSGVGSAAPISQCDLIVHDQSAGSWKSTFYACMDDAASDGYAVGEEALFIAGPATGVAIVSALTGAPASVFFDARSASPAPVWWGGDVSGPDATLRMERYGYAPAAPPIATLITWNLTGAADYRYVLYDDTKGALIVLEEGQEYLIDVPDGGVTLRLTGFPASDADFDDDSDVDLADFGHFAACFNGPNREAALLDCDDADLDVDNDVDLADFSEFAACFNGPNRPPALGCP